jgi:sigma-B regulation protein RsbU (phosphoserine phosphatase)
MDRSKISKISLFSTLDSTQMECVAASLRQVQVPGDKILFGEGDRGDRLYIVLEGQVEVIKALGTPEERVLAMLGPGDHMGEISLLDPRGLRTASVRTRTAVELAELTRADFALLLDRHPRIAYQLAKELSVHLRNADNATIQDLQKKNVQLREAYQDLKSAQAQIVEKEKLEHELKVAREIQQSILPRTLPLFVGFDFGARMLPARAVGGDFFDFIPLDENNMGVAIGDVSDKGVPAAIFMALTRSLMRAEARRSLTPGQALRSVNGHLLDMNSENMFVTVLYGVLNRGNRTFVYARAGHELPIVCAEDGHPMGVSRALGQPLGILRDTALDEQVLKLQPGAALLVYTDGITDAINSEDEPFGVERLQKEFGSCLHDPAQAICDRVMQAVIAFQEGTPQHDDLAIVVVRVLGT